MQINEKRRESDYKVLFDALLARAGSVSAGSANIAHLLTGGESLQAQVEWQRKMSLPTSSSAGVGVVDERKSSLPEGALSPGFASIPAPSRSATLPTLHALCANQNVVDQALDGADLRQLMKSALGAGSDMEMLEVLEVTKRDEMPEAIKTLQRALELVVERENVPGDTRSATKGDVGGIAGEKSGVEKAARPANLARRLSVSAGKDMGRLKKKLSTMNIGGSKGNAIAVSVPQAPPPPVVVVAATVKDTLDREFIETGIDALRRMSKGTEATLRLPSWTITR